MLSTPFKRYAFWSFITNTVSSTQSVLAIHSMYSTAQTGANSITTNMVSKDIVGQIGGAMYMYGMGKHIKLEQPKYIRKIIALQQTSLMVESMMPLFGPSLFIPIAGISNMTTNITYAGIGAVNAKIISDFGNVAELYTRMTAINTVASTIGMSIGLGISSVIRPEYTPVVVFLLIPLRCITFLKAIQADPTK